MNPTRKLEPIAEVRIDDDGHLHVVPMTAAFPHIYREAMEVYWKPETRSLVSPVPREWTYERWFQQIVGAALEQGYQLFVTADTRWANIEPSQKARMTAQAAPPMRDRDLAAKLLQDHFTATAALIALMLKNLPEEVRTRTLDAVRNGTGKIELRTRVETHETELLLVPIDGSEPLWLARTSGAQSS